MASFSEQLAAGLETLEIDISAEAFERLSVYFFELKKWSRKINLIARSATDEQIIEKHFLDSLTILPFLRNADTHLLDIGTGAGFPALVCKVAYPQLAVTLMEPRSKRVSFLGHIVRSLGLEQVKLLCCRVEEEILLPEDQSWTHITARAVTDIGTFLQMVERFSCLNPQLICMKGPKWQEEMAAASVILRHSSYKLDRVIDATLPFSRVDRSILVFEVTN